MTREDPFIIRKQLINIIENCLKLSMAGHLHLSGRIAAGLKFHIGRRFLRFFPEVFLTAFPGRFVPGLETTGTLFFLSPAMPWQWLFMKTRASPAGE